MSTSSYFAFICAVFFILVDHVDSGSVGLCRTECIERNSGKIVRVHLKDDLVMIGLCRNSSSLDDACSVTPYICRRDVGTWTFDVNDSEGVVEFARLCPTPRTYPTSAIRACQRVIDDSIFMISQ